LAGGGHSLACKTFNSLTQGLVTVGASGPNSNEEVPEGSLLPDPESDALDIGWVDVHLLASARLSRAQLLMDDRALHGAALALGMAA